MSENSEAFVVSQEVTKKLTPPSASWDEPIEDAPPPFLNAIKRAKKELNTAVHLAEKQNQPTDPTPYIPEQKDHGAEDSLFELPKAEVLEAPINKQTIAPVAPPDNSQQLDFGF